MRHTDEEIAKFDPPTMICLLCKDELRSSYPGEFVMCSCKKSFVDQTLYYSRFGGQLVPKKSTEDEKKSEGSDGNG